MYIIISVHYRLIIVINEDPIANNGQGITEIYACQVTAAILSFV